MNENQYLWMAELESDEGKKVYDTIKVGAAWCSVLTEMAEHVM